MDTIGDCQSPPAQSLRAGGGSFAKKTPPPAAVDRIMRHDNNQELKELHVRLPKPLATKIRVCAAREELTVSAFLSQVISGSLASYPS